MRWLIAWVFVLSVAHAAVCDPKVFHGAYGLSLTGITTIGDTPRAVAVVGRLVLATVVKMMRAIGGKVPFDWQLIVNGYLPDYAYGRGALDTRLPLPELKALAHIDKRAREAGLSSDFSRLIRVSVPSPREQQTP